MASRLQMRYLCQDRFQMGQLPSPTAHFTLSITSEIFVSLIAWSSTSSYPKNMSTFYGQCCLNVHLHWHNTRNWNNEHMVCSQWEFVATSFSNSPYFGTFVHYYATSCLHIWLLALPPTKWYGNGDRGCTNLCLDLPWQVIFAVLSSAISWFNPNQSKLYPILSVYSIARQKIQKYIQYGKISRNHRKYPPIL